MFVYAVSEKTVAVGMFGDYGTDTRTDKHTDSHTDFRINSQSINRSPHTAATIDKNNNVRRDTTIFVTSLLPKCIVMSQ